MSAFDPAAWVADFEAQGGSVRFDVTSGKLWLGVDDVDGELFTTALASITGWPGRREILKAWTERHRPVA